MLLRSESLSFDVRAVLDLRRSVVSEDNGLIFLGHAQRVPIQERIRPHLSVVDAHTGEDSWQDARGLEDHPLNSRSRWLRFECLRPRRRSVALRMLTVGLVHGLHRATGDFSLHLPLDDQRRRKDVPVKVVRSLHDHAMELRGVGKQSSDREVPSQVKVSPDRAVEGPHDPRAEQCGDLARGFPSRRRVATIAIHYFVALSDRLHET